MRATVGRLEKLERRAGEPSGVCQCVGRGPGTGWRVVGLRLHLNVPEDAETVCRFCGLERPVFLVKWDRGPGAPDAPEASAA